MGPKRSSFEAGVDFAGAVGVTLGLSVMSAIGLFLSSVSLVISDCRFLLLCLVVGVLFFSSQRGLWIGLQSE